MTNSQNSAKSPFNEATFACFDFETTGFSPKKDRVIEVAVVTVTQGRVGTGWTTLVNPGPDVELGASHIHGISVTGFAVHQALPILQKSFSRF